MPVVLSGGPSVPLAEGCSRDHARIRALGECAVGTLKTWKIMV